MALKSSALKIGAVPPSGDGSAGGGIYGPAPMKVVGGSEDTLSSSPARSARSSGAELDRLLVSKASGPNLGAVSSSGDGSHEGGIYGPAPGTAGGGSGDTPSSSPS